MTSKDEPSTVDLYLHQEKKIEKIQDTMATFLKEQMDTHNKVDRVLDAQNHLQNRFDKSSETGFKTFEMVKELVADIGGVKQAQTEHARRIDKVEGFNGKYLVGMLVVAVTAVVCGVISVTALVFRLKLVG